MPIYEYRCEECGHKFEAWLRSSQSPEPAECPRCNTSAIRRVPSLFGSTRPAGSVADSINASCGPATGG